MKRRDQKRANALAIGAARNEAFALTALERFADAELLRQWADQKEREQLRRFPLVHRSRPAHVESPGVRAVISDYQEGRDKVQPK